MMARIKRGLTWLMKDESTYLSREQFARLLASGAQVRDCGFGADAKDLAVALAQVHDGLAVVRHVPLPQEKLAFGVTDKSLLQAAAQGVEHGPAKYHRRATGVAS